VTKLLRAVFDTNVFVSAFLSRNPSSPTKELLERWKNGELVLLTSDALADELVEKLLQKGIPHDDVVEFLALLAQLAKWIEVPDDAVRPLITKDPDDDHVIACALTGNADCLVTYDPHFETLGECFEGVEIMKALPFLWKVRGDRPPGEKS
jgi:putative PIN family toxin of toxin-antitoxin system